MQDFEHAPLFGQKAVATGEGGAVDLQEHTISLQVGEPLRVVSIYPEDGRLIVNRTLYNSLAIISPNAIELTR